MKLLRTLPLILLSVVAHAQTATPPAVWFNLVPTEVQTTYVTVPANSTVRWCDAATGKTCSPTFPYASSTTFQAYCPNVSVCSSADGSDGLNTIPKGIWILETTATQKVTITNTAVTPNTSTSIKVPATAPPAPTTYPPIAFGVGVSYTVAMGTNVGTALTSTVVLTDSNNPTTVVTLLCTYQDIVTVAATPSVPAYQKAVFTCVPSPISQ